jgi:uncharacterized SAM-binding protein YcdF (DUF218 family)
MQSRPPASISRRQPNPRSNVRSRSRSRRAKFCRIVLIVLLLAIGYRQVQSYLVTPQAVLVLGGAVEREEFAAEFAKQHPDLPIWVSSGSNREYSEWVFAEAGIARERVHLDYRAKDTVTNFTTLVEDFQNQEINSIYLITSDDHMRRARIIGEIVFGSRGISIKPVAVESGRSPEPLEKAIRDAARSLLWVTTGYTGSTVGQFLRTRH